MSKIGLIVWDLFFSGIGKLFDGMHPLLNCLFSLDTDNPNKLPEIFGVSLFLFGSLVLFRFFFFKILFFQPLQLRLRNIKEEAMERS